MALTYIAIACGLVCWPVAGTLAGAVQVPHIALMLKASEFGDVVFALAIVLLATGEVAVVSGLVRSVQEEQEGFVKEYEVKFRKKNGTVMACLLTSTVGRANGGSILGYGGIIQAGPAGHGPGTEHLRGHRDGA